MLIWEVGQPETTTPSSATQYRPRRGIQTRDRLGNHRIWHSNPSKRTAVQTCGASSFRREPMLAQHQLGCCPLVNDGVDECGSLSFDCFVHCIAELIRRLDADTATSKTPRDLCEVGRFIIDVFIILLTKLFHPLAVAKA